MSLITAYPLKHMKLFDDFGYYICKFHFCSIYFPIFDKIIDHLRVWIYVLVFFSLTKRIKYIIGEEFDVIFQGKFHLYPHCERMKSVST